MSASTSSSDLISAARELLENEIELLKEIKSSRVNTNNTLVKSTNINDTENDVPPKIVAKPSAALLAAKREAVQRKKALGKKNTMFTDLSDIYQKAIDAKSMLHKETGIVYDHSMSEHKCLWDPEYPECPDRYTRVFQRCKELYLIQRCKYIPSRKAEYHELLLKHTPAHIELLKSTENYESNVDLEQLSSKYDAIYFHPSTYRLSLLAVGSTINLVVNICKGNIQNGMAIIRPPGHHAMKSEYCGYCFFNNVAVAAEVALRNNLVKKILIVDWDVHHGQATQKMFYNDPRVLYFSIHRYENGKFWPNLKESDYHYVGEKSGEGYNFNVPLNQTGMTNSDYIAIFQQVLLPVAYEFQPDLIIVSAGYDAALGCPEGLMNVTPACYAHLLSSLRPLASGRIAVVLEGGYCLKSLSESAAITLRALLGDPCPMLQMLEPPCKSVQESILNVIYSHKQYWNCFKYQSSYNIDAANDVRHDYHLPVVSFDGPESVQTTYETRNCYPTQSADEIKSINMQLNFLIQNTNLTKALHKVSLVYDEQMLKHFNTEDECHYEQPKRISSIIEKHKEYNLLKRCYVIEGRIATENELLLVHKQDYINEIKSLQEMHLNKMLLKSSNYNSVYFNSDTWNAARISVGSVLNAVDKVLYGESQAAVAVVRPPGHHALTDEACGFCIFNNVSIAAKYAISTHKLKRVLILDWDIHHGNGTQAIFEKDPKVLYISIHRFDNGTFFPKSKLANYMEAGLSEGKGFNVNIPWNKKGMGDPDYIAAFQQIVMPIAYQYNPELIIVSAGFDACIGDPLGGCKVSPEMYGHMTHWLSSLANGRIILALEGGYNVNSIAYAMTMCTKTLLGDPLIPLEPNQIPSASAVVTINNVLQIHKNFWPNLAFQKALPVENILPVAKVPRAKPTERLTVQDDISRLTSSENIKLEDESEPPVRKQLETIQSEDDVSQLEMNLDKLSIKKSVDTSEEQIKSNSKEDEAAASSSNAEQRSETSDNTNKSTLFHYLQDNMQALIDEKMYAVIPLNDCPHLDSVHDVPPEGININSPCQECDSTAENWVCLKCYTVHCSRSINQHALQHQQNTKHPLTLSICDISVWCYSCSSYIDNQRLYPARNVVHKKKFNMELPWTYHNIVECSSQS